MTRPDRRIRHMFALLRQAGIEDRHHRLTILSAILADNVESVSDLETTQISGIVDVLDYWKKEGELRERCYAILYPKDEKAKISFAGNGAPPNAAGRQLVQVQFEPGGNLFTYAWDGDVKLQVGDVVETPPPWWIPSDDPACGEPGVATVHILGSDYKGVVTLLTKRHLTIEHRD